MYDPLTTDQRSLAEYMDSGVRAESVQLKNDYINGLNFAPNATPDL